MALAFKLRNYQLSNSRRRFPVAALFLALLATASFAQKAPKDQPPADASHPANTAAEDISGMYSFLKEDEFLQINLDQGGVSGYISREGVLESDRGQFLDHFFSKASIQGHDVNFVTRPVHGVWFEFKGRFDRNPAKTKAQDGYYVLRGTLTEFRTDGANKSTSHSRSVEFLWLAQPDEK